MGADKLSGMNRRRFFQEAGRWSTGVLLASFASTLRGDECGFLAPDFPRPPLDQACLEPEDDTERILAAVVDTVVPGPSLDSEGAPGALEGCAINLLFDDFYPFREYATLLAGLMEGTAQGEFNRPFLEISYEERLVVLHLVQETAPILRLAYKAIRSAFFGGAYNGLGLTYVGYPGPNLGYRHLPEASFRRPVCREMTDTGWMP